MERSRFPSRRIGRRVLLDLKKFLLSTSVRLTASLRLPVKRGGEFSCRLGGEFQCRLTSGSRPTRFSPFERDIHQRCWYVDVRFLPMLIGPSVDHVAPRPIGDPSVLPARRMPGVFAVVILYGAE